MTAYTALFSPLRVNAMHLENRILMAPMATNFAGPGGEVNETLLAYYAERARGGCGLIIVENANVDFPLGANGAVQLRIDGDRFVPGLATLREAINDANPGCRAALQINHPGGQTKAARTGGNQVVAPSAVPTNPAGETPRPLTVPEIDRLVHQFALAAERAKRAGFDAVEIHGGFCYLLAQFLSPFFNRRADEYGGNSTNRARFPLRIVGAIRESVGPAFPILFRLNADEFIDGGTTVEESRLYASLLEKASVDLIHVTAGSGFAVSRHIEPMSFEQGWKAYLAGEIKKAVSVPVAAVGNIKEPAVAEAVLQRGDADCIAIGRALLADPYWPLKAKNGARINRCISCNVCAGKRLAYDGPVRCSVNPFVGSEYREILRRPPARLRSVLIAGAGPAGMKAAAEAAKDGHTVILAERADRVGGRALMAAAPPHKEKALWLVEDLAAQIRQARVDLRLGVTVDRAYIESVRPDAVIVACGSESCLPPFLAGAAAERTVLAEDVLSGFPVSPSLTVGVIGGGSVGCECAELLAEAGNTVFIFEMRDAVAMDLDPISRADLLTRLAALNVAVRERHCFQNFTDGTLTCTFGCEQTRQAVDLLVPATGFRRPSALLETLQGSAYPHLVIGDAARPGRFVDATRQGRLAADWLGAPGLG